MPVAKNMTVLVVDDQDSMRGLAKVSLNKLGITKVADVGDAKTALTRMQQTKFDLVICDWIMADMDGLALVTKMRADPVLESTPFIMASARRNLEQIAAALKAGVTGCLVKPFKPEDLKAGIEKACGGALQ
ncbi:MAG TPA: response regulator [Candidatus Acidoferrum sp.]|nr:response regulator [Candidatus Acidoferrum sp.]